MRERIHLRGQGWAVRPASRWLRLADNRPRLGTLLLRVEFALEDLWLGAFWCVSRDYRGSWYDAPYEVRSVDVWICLLPCVPLHFHWTPWEDPGVPF